MLFWCFVGLECVVLGCVVWVVVWLVAAFCLRFVLLLLLDLVWVRGFGLGDCLTVWCLRGLGGIGLAGLVWRFSFVVCGGFLLGFWRCLVAVVSCGFCLGLFRVCFRF